MYIPDWWTFGLFFIFNLKKMLSEDPGLKLSKYCNEHYCTQTFDCISDNVLGKNQGIHN